jgi:hypothetical protein
MLLDPKQAKIFKSLQQKKLNNTKQLQPLLKLIALKKVL